MNKGYATAAAAYGRAQYTRSELSVLVEIYDRMIATLSHAREARKQGELDREFELAEIVVRALVGLKSRLNHKRGGTVAVSLENYYGRLIAQLQMRHTSADRDSFYASLIRQVSLMRDSWSNIAGQNRSQPGMGEAREAQYRM